MILFCFHALCFLVMMLKLLSPHFNSCLLLSVSFCVRFCGLFASVRAGRLLLLLLLSLRVWRLLLLLLLSLQNLVLGLGLVSVVSIKIPGSYCFLPFWCCLLIVWTCCSSLRGFFMFCPVRCLVVWFCVACLVLWSLCWKAVGGGVLVTLLLLVEACVLSVLVC